jgi:hypothetical protein
MRRKILLGLAGALLLVGTCEAATTVTTGLSTYGRMAVLVGVDRYQCRDVKVFPDLHGCQTDVRRMGQTLYSKYRFSGLPTKGEPSQPIILLNEQATKQKILEKLKAVVAAAGNHDQVLFYFSGYGSFNGKPTLCPYDALANSAANDILAGELYEFVSHETKGLKAKGATGIIILDCSFCPPQAQTLGLTAAVRQKRAARPFEAAENVEEQIRRPLDSIVGSNGVLITACEPGEVAREIERGDDIWMSIFTRFLVDELAIQDDQKLVNYRALVGNITPRIKRYVAGKFPADPFNQTPHLYCAAQEVVAKGLFSTGARELPKAESDRVRLRFNYFGDDAALGQSLRNEFASRPYLQMTDEQPEQSLFLFKGDDGLQGYMVNSVGEITDQLSYHSSGEAGNVVEYVDQRAGSILAYRWPGKLPDQKGDRLPLKVKMVAKNAAGETVDQIQAGEPIMITVTAEQKCYFTFYAILPNGDFDRIPLKGQAEDCLALSPEQPWNPKPFRPSKCARYRLLVIAKDRPEVSSDGILRSLWEETKDAYAEVTADAATANVRPAGTLGAGGMLSGPPPPGYVAAQVLGPEDREKVICGADLLDLAIKDRTPEPAGPAERTSRAEFMSWPVGTLTLVGATTLGRR